MGKQEKIFCLIKNMVTIVALSAYFSYCASASDSFMPALLPLCICFVFLLRKTQEKISSIQAFIFGFAAFLLHATIAWLIREFPLEDCDQVLLTLQMPLGGFVLPFVLDYLSGVVFLGIVCTLLSLSFFRRVLGILSLRGKILCFGAILIWNVITICIEVPLDAYFLFIKDDSFNSTLTKSDFWKQNYVNIDSVDIAMPKEPRNLILIIMESMENWPDSLTPELKKLSKENVAFSSTDSLGGGADVAGSKNTYCSTISKTMGLPMMEFTLYRNGEYLARAKSIYEILHRFEYRNIFLQGTDANFANFRTYLEKHGVDQIFDTNNLKDNWDMDVSFRNLRSFFAGFTDKRLYDISKEILDSISKDRFSLTIATIETHSPYGFYDDRCVEKPESQSEESKFKATLKCASRQVYEFVEWAEQQDFYKNTEIVIVGDHLFMGKYFIENRNREWLSIFVNPQIYPTTKKRRFVSLDIAPSIIESMGFQIEGHRMGLGTSLFSDSLTLLEKMSKERLNIELKKLSRSVEYNQLHLPYKR